MLNLGETYLVTETGNERLGKQKLDLVVLKGLGSSLPIKSYTVVAIIV